MKAQSNVSGFIQALRAKQDKLPTTFNNDQSKMIPMAKAKAHPKSIVQFPQMNHSKFSNLAGITQKPESINNSNIGNSRALSWIHNTTFYKKFKKFQKIVYLLLEEPGGSLSSKFIFCLIMTCVVVSAIEEIIVNSTTIPKKSSFIEIIDLITSTIFIVELILRLLCASAFGESIKTYILRPYFLIDFIAILPPFFEGFGDSSLAIKSIVNSRILGLFRIFRLFKISRYIKDASIFIEGVKKSLASFGFLILLMVIANLTFATMIYYAESSTKESKLSNGIPVAMWWALVTMATVGYGDVVPITPEGKVIASLTAIFGNLMLTFPVVILGYNFQEVYANKQEEKQVTKLKENIITKSSNMTTDKKEIFFMKQRISSIEETNKHIMKALANSENLYKKVSLDLKDLFRSIYMEMEDSENENATTFNKKIKLMEKLAKTKRKIKLVHLFRRAIYEKKDSETSQIKTDKEESPTKIKPDLIILKNASLAKERNDSLSLGSSFAENDENPAKIVTTYYPFKKRLEKFYMTSDKFSSDSEDEEPNKLHNLKTKESVLFKEKLRRSRLKIFELDSKNTIRPFKTVIEKNPSPLKNTQTKAEPSPRGMFCIKSHSQDNPNAFLKYRNERLNFLDNRILNELLEDFGNFEAHSSVEDNSSPYSTQNARQTSRFRLSVDEPQTRRSYIRQENGYDTLRNLLRTDNELRGDSTNRSSNKPSFGRI